MVKPFYLFPRKLFAYLLMLCSVLLTSSKAQTLDNQHIGFALIETSRQSENWSSDTSEKPLTGWFWFPIVEQPTETMTCRKYLEFLSPGKSSREQTATFQRIINGFQEDTISTESIETYLDQDSPVRAVGDAPNHQKTLIVLSGAHPIYFIELAERLAQSGYAVIFVPRTGQKHGERLPYSAKGVEEYESDLQTMLDHLDQSGYADVSELAFVSWSFEGIATLHLANKAATKCFISLDAAIGYDYGVSLVRESIFDQKVSFPIIHYTGTSLGHGKQLNLLTKHSDQVRLIDKFDFSHGDFTSISSLTAHQLISGSPNKRYEALIDAVLTQLRSAFEE